MANSRHHFPPIREMLNTIARETEFTASQTGRSRLRPDVMEAMAEVPREEFVPPDLRSRAYSNNPLPIGEGQTISQPFIVALMTDLLDPEPEDIILEIGTGSGYQAAILSRLVRRVYTIEVVPRLAQEAAARLKRLRYDNVEVRTGDGHGGWPEHAPYEGIITTAAAPRIPEALKEQLQPGGRLVIPVGRPFSHQELLVIEKGLDSACRTRQVLGVAFVPLIGEDAPS